MKVVMDKTGNMKTSQKSWNFVSRGILPILPFSFTNFVALLQTLGIGISLESLHFRTFSANVANAKLSREMVMEN